MTEGAAYAIVNAVDDLSKMVFALIVTTLLSTHTKGADSEEVGEAIARAKALVQQ